MCNFRCRQRLLFFALKVALSCCFRVSRSKFLLSLPAFSARRAAFQRGDSYEDQKNRISSQILCVRLKSSTFSDQELGVLPSGGDRDWYTSRIASIKAYNLAGVVSEGADKIISIDFGDFPNLVAVTGETGSGKSLLIAKLADLVTGGKATASLLPTLGDDNVVIAEMEIALSQPHLSYVQTSFENIGLDPSHFLDPTSTAATLKLRRVLSLAGPSMKGGKSRLKSICEINGRPVSLKDLKAVASPLVAIVDASAAATALAKPNSRMAIIDAAVSPNVLEEARRTQVEYKRRREQREKLENEVANMALPPSLSGDGEQDLELLKHWVDELDHFQGRMNQFSDALDQLPKSEDSFGDAVRTLSALSWFDIADTDSFSSLMYIHLLDFREALKSLDSQLDSARMAFEKLASLSSTESAMTAVDLARNHLFDVTANENPDGRFSLSAEISHDLLNQVEEKLRDCLKSLEDERIGLLTMLENTRDKVVYNVGDIDTIIADWNSLARKHGMSPYALPSCHAALQSELNGNVEARMLLPKAIAQEGVALTAFKNACIALSTERQKIGKKLSVSVTKRMPLLGLEGSKFEVQTSTGVRRCEDASCYASSTVVGFDAVDFLLLHEVDSAIEEQQSRGGKIEVVASSGEKARLLLAIECEHPGSIGASCGISIENDATATRKAYPPVSLIYDEIDAHVGGRAAVAMGNMLVDQSRKRNGSGARGQIISITHSPSVAAIADVHLVIQKQSNRNGEQSVSVVTAFVEGTERRKELARMASGDLAPEEAEAFAQALLRDAAKRRSNN